MSKVQWRPQLNALTSPQSYRAQPVPRESLGYDEMAALIAAKNPLWSPDLVKSILLAERETRKEQLISGNQVSYENNCTWHLSISARLAAPDDPLPQDKDILNVQAYASRTFVDEVRQAARLERLPITEKVPVISSAEDMLLKLNDVLNPAGLLRLTGDGLFFDPESGGGECVLEGTNSGRTAQTRFGTISNTAVLLMPDIVSQTDPWNNEYRVSISTRYTAHGSLRTGICAKRLRTPLSITLGNGDGILSGSGDVPLVTVNEGTLTDERTRMRLQAVLNAQDGDLRMSLLDMTEGGAVGNEVRVMENGAYTLAGFAESPLTSLNITVNDYAALVNMIRTDYFGRVVDVLDVAQGT